MKIGFLIYGSLDTLSGGYLYDRKLVEYLRAHGDEVEIISLPWRNYATHLTDNLWFRLWSPGARSWSFRQQAVGLQKFDVLIQDELNHPSLVVANMGKHEYPVISLVHHLRCSELRPKWQNIFYRIIERKYLRLVDGFIFNSQTTKGVVNSLTDYNKPFVLAYPPTDRFGDAVSEEMIKSRAKNNPFRILFLGNVIERKGLHTLLKSLILFHPSSLTLDVVGSLTSDSRYAKRMQDFVVANGISDNVKFHGPLVDESLRKIYQQSHVLVVPSSYEGFGIVYLEGMSFGLPAIGTTAGAASEIIEDGRTGYLINPGDYETLAMQLLALAKDRDLLAQLSIQARARYVKQPKWNETAGQIREFLLHFTHGDS